MNVSIRKVLSVATAALLQLQQQPLPPQQQQQPRLQLQSQQPRAIHLTVSSMRIALIHNITYRPIHPDKPTAEMRYGKIMDDLVMLDFSATIWELVLISTNAFHQQHHHVDPISVASTPMARIVVRICCSVPLAIAQILRARSALTSTSVRLASIIVPTIKSAKIVWAAMSAHVQRVISCQRACRTDRLLTFALTSTNAQ